MTYTIEAPKLLDLPRILVSAKTFIEYLDSRDTPWDEARVSFILTNLINSAYFRIIKKDGEFIGMIAAVPVPGLWTTKVTHLEEVFWWIDPEHRKSRASYMLLKDFVTFSKTHNLKPILHLLSHSNINPRSLEKLGFKLKEHTFYME